MNFRKGIRKFFQVNKIFIKRPIVKFLRWIRTESKANVIVWTLAVWPFSILIILMHFLFYWCYLFIIIFNSFVSDDFWSKPFIK